MASSGLVPMCFTRAFVNTPGLPAAAALV